MCNQLKRLLLMITSLALAASTTLPVLAQNPTGSIRGTITDPQGAVIQNATVTVTNKSTGDVRKVNTSPEGVYAVENLLPGDYEVKIEAQGFATEVMSLVVQVGSTTTGNAGLRIGQAGEIVDVVADAPLIDKTNFKIDGVITRQKIDALPLNGRNFLQLALLEPGVSVSVSNTGDANNLFNVSIGGGNSALTRITVDGGSVLDPVTGGAAQNFSTETIQEFQISTFNFDLATGVTSLGAVNIVSRTGTNAYHGAGFLYFRDHSLAALPTFFRPKGSFDPFFRRYQYGGNFGGPIKKDRAFFFANVERLDQNGIVSVFNTGTPIGAATAPPFSQFNTSFNSPYKGYLLNFRGDIKVNDKNNVFVRFSRDDNHSFAPVTDNSMPSNWRSNVNKDNNVQAGLTTVLRQNLVNDVRFNYQRINNSSLTPSASDCPASDPRCIGVGGPEIEVLGTNFIIGNQTNAPQTRVLDRYQTRDDMNWQKGAHHLKFGGEWEHNYGTGSWDFFDPAIMVLHDPRVVLGVDALVAANLGPLAPLFTIPVPASFLGAGPITYNDILQLPLAGAVAGVGDAVQPPSFHTDIARQSNRFRFYGQDSWLVKPGFTLSYGASYQYETNLGNSDLTHPAVLQLLTGPINHSKKDKKNIAPSLGFAWDVKNDGKTVLRGGGGIYFDTILFVTRLLERPLLGPAGNGRLAIPTAFFRNTNSYPQIPLPPPAAIFGLINPPIGAGLSFTTIPSKFTGANLLTALNQQVPPLQALLAAGASAGFDSFQFVKTAQLPGTLLDPNLTTPYSEQFSFGVERQLPHTMALSADFVLRKRVHETQGVGSALDLNQFNRSAAQGGPRIPQCTGLQAVDPNALCSNGPIPIIQSINRSTYKALLVKLDKRFSNRFQFTASYALSELTGYFINENLNDWFANHGDLGSDARHRFSFSGVVNLPWDIQTSLIAVYASRAPFDAHVPGNVDTNGDGTFGDTLPGLKVNSLARGTSKAGLTALVNNYNLTVAGPSLGVISPLVLPSRYTFGDTFQSEDIRVSKSFKFKERYSIQGLVEIFNIFNIANLTGFGQTLDSGRFADPKNPSLSTIIAPGSFSFGQPTLRAGQSFGTGGPRAIQLGARFTF